VLADVSPEAEGKLSVSGQSSGLGYVYVAVGGRRQLERRVLGQPGDGDERLWRPDESVVGRDGLRATDPADPARLPRRSVPAVRLRAATVSAVRVREGAAAGQRWRRSPQADDLWRRRRARTRRLYVNDPPRRGRNRPPRRHHRQRTVLCLQVRR